MDDWRAELALINAGCAQRGIDHALLNVADVAALMGWSRKTVKKHFRFGGTARRPVLSRSQMARQLYELSLYRAG